MLFIMYEIKYFVSYMLLKLGFFTEISLRMFHSWQPPDLNLPPSNRHVSIMLKTYREISIISGQIRDRYQVLFSDWSITRHLDHRPISILTLCNFTFLLMLVEARSTHGHGRLFHTGHYLPKLFWFINWKKTSKLPTNMNQPF